MKPARVSRGNQRFEFLVSLKAPAGANRDDARDYVDAAVRCWSGSLYPGDDDDDGDPMYYLDADSVVIKDKS